MFVPKELANSETKVLGLLGHKIGYSLSPLIHNFSIQKLGLDCTYLLFDLTEANVGPFIDEIWKLGALGLNITKPYKSSVTKFIETSQSAVNTLFRSDKKFGGLSTDINGLEKALARSAIDFYSFDRIVILGNGGVVLSLCEHVAQYFKHPVEIYVHSRGRERDDLLKNCFSIDFPIYFRGWSPEELSLSFNKTSLNTLLIQATSAPQHGDPLTQFSSCIEKFSGAVVDMTYTQTSAILKSARKRGLPNQDGLPMLIEQARLSQNKWWGISASYDDIYEMLIRTNSI